MVTEQVRSAVRPSSFRRSMFFMTGSSVMLPVVGLASAPILAYGLGVAGRGTVSAAGAPNTLLVGVATLGLPEALTFFLAKQPQLTRRALAWASLFAVLLGLVCFGATWLALPFLSAGSGELGKLILISTALAIPQLVVNLLRGAASGRQMWGSVAAEKVTSPVIRLAALLVLLITGQLTVLTAVLVISLGSALSGLAYVRLFTRPTETSGDGPITSSLARSLLGFGGRVWLGAVASVLLARISQLLFAPLSSVHELGLFVVGITISDVPLIVALAIRDALYGVNSRSADASQLMATTRITLLTTVVGCLALGATLPLWIGILFGPSFDAAVVPTWILMLSAVVSIPGFLAASGLGAWGRPGLRSIGLAITLVVNVGAFMVLVPTLGAVGAGIAGLAGGLFSSAFMVLAAARILQGSVADFVVPRREDVGRILREARLLTRRFRQ